MFIDKVLKKYPKLPRPEAIFNIQNVADYVFNLPKSNYEMKDCFCLKPPFPQTSFEFTTPKNINIPTRQGYPIVKQTYLFKETRMNTEEEAYFLEIRFFVEMEHGIENTLIAQLGINKYGEIICSENKKEPLIKFLTNKKTNEYIDDIIEIRGINAIAPGLCDKESAKISIATFASLPVILVALNFLHCKNVAQEEVKINIQPKRKKWLQSKGNPYFEKYYVLKIEPMKKILDTKGGAQETGIKRALHICRGYFSHYSEEKPLFGKYSGTFWVPAHTRGSSEIGIIDKDYKLLAPKI